MTRQQQDEDQPAACVVNYTFVVVFGNLLSHFIYFFSADANLLSPVPEEMQNIFLNLQKVIQMKLILSITLYKDY